jgi:hypothetical protein
MPAPVAGGSIMEIKHIHKRQDCDGELAGIMFITALIVLAGIVIGLVVWQS